MVKVREQRDIEALVVWALRDQGLGWAGKERSVLDFSDYGTVIDDDHSGSHPNMGLWSDDDAMQIKLAIEQLPREAGSLLIQYGRAGLRPDWCEDGYGNYRQLTDGRGRPMWDWSDPKNRTGEKRPRMGFVGEQRETVDYHRAQYRVWWQGLADIVGPVNQGMERHEALPPAAREQPWLADAASKPVVFDADGGVIHSEPAAPKVSVASVEELRYLANTPVRSTANDWEAPAVPIERKEHVSRKCK